MAGSTGVLACSRTCHTACWPPPTWCKGYHFWSTHQPHSLVSQVTVKSSLDALQVFEYKFIKFPMYVDLCYLPFTGVKWFLDYGHVHKLHAQLTNPTSCATTALSSGNWRNISVISQAGVESACYGRRNEGVASLVRSVSWLRDVGMPNSLIWRIDIVHWFHCKLETAGVDASFMGSCPGPWLKMIFVHWVD